jgi:hypothetical protein
MSYIRTKDDRIIQVGEYTSVLVIDAMYGVTKEAEKMEDLFDCFVDYCEEDDSYFVSMERPIVMHGHEIYGAIWTKWGLKYLAVLVGKMAWRLL